MKTPGFEARFSQNLAPVGARKATKPLPCLHFTFIQQTLINSQSNLKNPLPTLLYILNRWQFRGNWNRCGTYSSQFIRVANVPTQPPAHPPRL